MGGFDVSYLAAAAAGLISFLSPCVLPLVPAYLCYAAGASLEELTETGADEAAGRRILVSAFAFVLGFSTVFIALGASASAINHFLLGSSEIMGHRVHHLDLAAKIAGVVIVVFGLHYMGLFRIALLEREARLEVETRPVGLFGAYVLGLAFAFGWTPCVGPILSAILAIAASEDSLGYGVSLLAVYAAGLGIPFMLAALAVNRFLGLASRFRRHLRKVEIAAGLLLVATGFLMFFGALQTFGTTLLIWFPALGELEGWFIEAIPGLSD